MIRVLIADSDPQTASEYHRELKNLGFDVRVCETGLQCVSELTSFRPRVLVLDPKIPWGWGDGVLAVLRDDGQMPETKVIVLSSDSMEQSLQLLRDHPKVQCVHQKPLSPASLAEAVSLMCQPRDEMMPFE